MENATIDAGTRRSVARPTAAVGILATLLFVAATAMLKATRAPLDDGLFPPEATREVLDALTIERTLALSSFLLHIVGLAGWLIYLPALAKLLPLGPRRVAHIAFVLGTVIAIAGFIAATGAVMSLPSRETDTGGIVAMLRVGILGDILGATFVLVPGVGTTALIGRRQGWLPGWLGYLGVGVAAVWAAHVLFLTTPLRGPTVIGAPLGLLWLIGTGAVLLRKGTAARS